MSDISDISDCRCVRGHLVRASGEHEVVVEPYLQINGNDVYHVNKFCPKCGKKLDFEVVMPHAQFTRLLNPDRLKPVSKRIPVKKKVAKLKPVSKRIPVKK